MDSRILSTEHAAASGVAEPWEGSNEAWWDWYLSLADDESTPPELVEVSPPPAVDVPSIDELREGLATPMVLSDEQTARFRADGYLKVGGVLSPGALALARTEVDRLAAQGEGPGRSGFLSLDLMWQGDSEVLRLFALSPRLGRLAADLLGVADARIYHDNVLSKTPGCGRTPWHFDAHHFPIASRDIVTSWIPLQAIPEPMGPLAFAAGIDTWKLAEEVDFNRTDSSYDRGVAQAFREAGVQVDDGPFALGEVSFHHA
jgi:ectoine hydroxylase-related dioxygenase (phytanoyl-CoA dioxygenase family)